MGSRVAARLSYPFLDTGVMYRAVTWLVLDRGIDPADASAVLRAAMEMRMRVEPALPGLDLSSRVYIDDNDVTTYLRSPEVEMNVSAVSGVRALRHILVDRQRELGRAGPIVMAGRDIGSVVLPDAPLKVYLDAALEQRARRRLQERLEKGEPVTFEQVLADLRRRDEMDNRTTPFRPAPGAVVIDTTNLSLDEVVEQVLGEVRCRP